MQEPGMKETKHNTMQVANQFSLWDPEFTIPNRSSVRELKNVELITVKPNQPDIDNYIFHHGAAIISFKAQLFVSIAVNKGVENTSGEEAIVLKNNDGGITWSGPKVMEAPEKNTGISHGDFIVSEEKLWALHACFGHIETLPTLNNDARGEFKDVFPGLAMKAYQYNEDSDDWVSQGVVSENFWPLAEPVRLNNGNWFVTGLNKDFLAACAISDGDNLRNWKQINIPMDRDIKANETGFWTNGKDITAVIRNQRPVVPEKPYAVVSHSNDYGETWTPARESNLLFTVSKPYCGMLSTGQRYLIGNSLNEQNSHRRYLTIALSQPGKELLSSLYLIRDVSMNPSPAGNAVVRSICYPHAVEHNGYLYVIHSTGSSHNINNIDLSIIPLKEFDM